MNSFPVITNDLIADCFSRLCTLYASDSMKILQAAQAVTSGRPAAFIIGANSINDQLEIIVAKVKKTADREGQKLLIKIIEHLYDDLHVNGATGVTNTDFLECTKIKFQDESEIQYGVSKKWQWKWELKVDDNSGSVDLDIRTGNTNPGQIVPEYILQYIQQGVAAYKTSKHAVGMALMTIALEGTLRDALHAKGYTYQYGTPSQDVFEIKDVQIHKDPLGFKVIFPDPMPQNHSQYLSSPGDPAYNTYRIKRVKKPDGSFILEIRNVADLVDFWSSDQVTRPGTMQISGLGAALDIGRNHLTIITPLDIPEDLDNPIKAVRNNLIHLSGTSMLEVVQQDSNGNNITLSDFLSNKNRVFDAICTIGSSINTIYNRIANRTL